jgi:hypothetical protein
MKHCTTRPAGARAGCGGLSGSDPPQETPFSGCLSRSLRRWRDGVRRTARSFLGWARRRTLPLEGYVQNRTPSPLLELLDDRELAELNALLPWSAFVVDGRGRRFGSIAWNGKRIEPQEIPDRRVLMLDERFSLADKTALEFGCFEGIHTVALCRLARQVTAIDARVENVVKTMVRCAFFDQHPKVIRLDVEKPPANDELPAADVACHIGVLYHLRDPVRHLLALGRRLRLGLLLDTHFALDEEAALTYEVDGVPWRYKRYREHGRQDVFSGMYDHSKWLRLEDIVLLLRLAGFAEVELIEKRAERNGPRALLVAQRGH